MATTTKAPKTKKKDIKLPLGVLHVHTTSNNTIVTLTDPKGNTVLGGGTGKVGFKHSKKSTPYAAEVLTKQIIKDAQIFGLKELGIVLNGLGMSRDGVFKAVNESGLVDIQYITENTSLQHGGCKGVRPRRN